MCGLVNKKQPTTQTHLETSQHPVQYTSNEEKKQKTFIVSFTQKYCKCYLLVFFNRERGKKKTCGNTAIAGLDLRAVKMKNWSTTFLAPVSNRWRKKGGVIGSPPSRDSPSHSALQRLRGPVRAAISASVHLVLFPLKAIPGTLP